MNLYHGRYVCFSHEAANKWMLLFFAIGITALKCVQTFVLSYKMN